MASLLRSKVPKDFLDWYETERKERNKKLPKGQTYRPTSPLSLKVLAPWYLKVEPFWETPGDYSNLEYNQKDCEYTWRLAQLFEERLKDEGAWNFYANRLLEWQQMLTEMELRGISLNFWEMDTVHAEYSRKRELYRERLDTQWAQARSIYLEKQQAEIGLKYKEMAERAIAKSKNPEKTATRYAGLMMDAQCKIEPLNYASPDQMSWLLKEQLGLDITDPEGEETTGKSVLHRLAVEREDIRNLLEYKEADKVLTMYLPTYRELEVGGIIHPEFNLTGTRTGRTSSSNPNMQQVPSKLYRLFRSRPGHVFLDKDLSGIEAALIALYSGDPALYNILVKNESVHDHNVRTLFDIEDDLSLIATKYPRQRKTAKNLGFACFFGAGWRRIQIVFAQGGFPITEKQAKEKLRKLKTYYSGVFDFHAEITNAFESGETINNLFGRPIKMQPHENCHMQAMNTLIQSSASDLNLRACQKWVQECKARRWDAYPLIVIHDCIIGEAEESIAQDADKLLIECMTNFKLESIHGPIKLRAEGKISSKWEK